MAVISLQGKVARGSSACVAVDDEASRAYRSSNHIGVSASYETCD